MDALEIARAAVEELPVRRFLSEYVQPNRPLVVTGALQSWNIEHDWTPAALEQRFGGEVVQVYNNYFDLQTLMPLRQYLLRYFGRKTSGLDGIVPYVRWYTKLRDVEFPWADAAFRQLRDRWALPAFLPDSGYVLPWLSEGRASPVLDPFPAKGIFISPRGARTSLHVDPWGSCAVLCQLYGYKRWYLYAPDQGKYLRNDAKVVDVTRPDHESFPGFSQARMGATCVLGPGEAIYVPHGWYHQVECESDSISITWNFVHRTTAASLLDWLEQTPLSEFDLSVLRFFYGLSKSSDVATDVLARVRHRVTEGAVVDGSA